MPIDATELEEDLLLGRYRIHEIRGTGGFATVYLCWDPRLMRRVAIKAISLTPLQPTGGRKRGKASADTEQIALERLQRERTLRAALAETRTASMLAHPNIVSMLDFESDDEYAYIIMEYVEGASLAELLDSSEDGLLTWDEAAAVVEAVCDALQFAHDNGVLHLDIKPDNILIDPAGHVKLADFGMAALSSATGYSGARGGTLGYMPPEQLMGANVDVRCDVYAFAAVMYEALTAVRPFAAKTPEESLDLAQRGAADPCVYAENLPSQVADALLVALDPDPDVRPCSAQALADELLAGLGRPKAGRRSLAGFVRDTIDDSEVTPDEPEITEQFYDDPASAELGPLSFGRPELVPRLLAFTGGLAGGIVTGLALLSILGTGSGGACVAAGIAVGLLALASPHLSGATAIISLVVAAGMAHAWIPALLVLITGACWWFFVARKTPLSSAPTLCAGAFPALFSPIPALFCGLMLPWLPAALSALVGFVCCSTLIALSGVADPAAFSLASLAVAQPDQIAAASRALLTSVAHWTWGLAWTATAAIMGLLCHNRGHAACFAGCALASCMLAGTAIIVPGMEKGGVWATTSPELVAIMGASSILVAIAVLMFGTPRALCPDGSDDNELV